MQAVLERLEETLEQPKTFFRVAQLLAAMSLFALGYAVAELADGVREIPRHWWSVLPLIGLSVAGALALAGRARRNAT